MKITLLSEEAIRLEPTPGPLTVEADSADQLYSPFHMLASSLAFCTYSVLASWASNANLNVDDLAVEVRWTFAEDPHRVATMDMKMEWPSLPEGRNAAAQRVAGLCAVHATLTHSPTITATVSR
ncbi:MAG TPA: OsmC family protein [Gemmatimonadaceae bacterium]|nr:OsmC family protein [Gemmatimonadaceae bacterium]